MQDVMYGNSAVILQNNDTYFYSTWISSMALSINIVQTIETFNGALPCPPLSYSGIEMHGQSHNRKRSVKQMGRLHAYSFEHPASALTAGKVVVG